jgi:hypothetical protein
VQSADDAQDVLQVVGPQLYGSHAIMAPAMQFPAEQVPGGWYVDTEHDSATQIVMLP